MALVGFDINQEGQQATLILPPTKTHLREEIEVAVGKVFVQLSHVPS